MYFGILLLRKIIKVSRLRILGRLIDDQYLFWIGPLRDTLVVRWGISLGLIAGCFIVSPLFICSIALIPVPAFIGLIGMLVVVSISTGRFTGSELQSEIYDLLSLSNIGDREIVWSYIFAPIYRIRHALTFVIGFCPFLSFVLAILPFVATRVGLLGLSQIITSPYGNSYVDDFWRYRSLSSVYQGGLWLMSLTVNYLGLSFFTAAMSVYLALKYRNDLLSIIGPLLLVLPVSSFILLFLSGEIFLGALKIAETDSRGTLLFWCWNVFFAICPYVLGFHVARSAERLVRKPAY